MIYELLPPGWDRIFCHPSNWRLVCKLLTGQIVEERLQVAGRSVRIFIDTIVPLNVILIGNSKRVISFRGLSDAIQNVKENLKKDVMEYDTHSRTTDPI
jgi:hypothetical protein